MRKAAFLMIYAAMIPRLLFSQAVDVKDIPPDMKGILTNKDLVVAMTEMDQPSFYFKDKNGNLAGFDLDLALNIARELGAKRLIINREAKSFNDVVSLVASGKADPAISKLSRTPPRAKYAKFLKPS